MSDIIVPQSDVKLCTRNVNLYYGENHALKDINLDIKTNKITAFIGPSGCGKSTYLKSLNRMNDLVPDCKITGRFLQTMQDHQSVLSTRFLLKAQSCFHSPYCQPL